MKLEVEQAIEEIRSAFPGVCLDTEPDADGGAFVTTGELYLGPHYEPQYSWCGFHITFQYPFADIYPHYFHASLRRKDGKPLGEAFHASHQWQHPARTDASTMVSRRSNHRDPATETAALKLAKVLDWIRTR